MTGAKKLVIAASGFLGSDVTRQLFDRGDVFYCVVDTRAWLRDPAPLFRTNVEGLRHVTRRWTPIYGVSPSPAPSAYPPNGGPPLPTEESQCVIDARLVDA
jgi:hypothetical protein